jgi:O-antigen/teichoic acid export membrane protein
MNDYNVVLSFVTMFLLLSDFGTGGILIREGSRDSSKIALYFDNYFSIRLSITCVALIACLVVACFMPYDPQIKSYILIMAVSQLMFQVSQIFATIFQARQRMEYIMYGNVLQAVIYLTLGWVFVTGGMSVIGLICANLLANLALLAFNYMITRSKITRVRLGFNREIIMYLAIAGLPLGVNGFLTIIYSYVDRFLLSIFRYSEVANYTMPYTLVMSLSFIVLAYTSSVLPTFSRIFKNEENIRYTCELSLKYLTILVVPMCVGVTLLADRIIYTMYGNDFGSAIPVLQILVWILFFMVGTYVASPLLTAVHRERICMWIMIVTSIANVLLNIVLIPAYGAIGSSVASLLTIGVLNAFLNLWFIRPFIIGVGAKLSGTFVRVIVASGAMTASIVLINVDNLVLYVIMGACVYFATFVVSGGLSRNDIELFRRVLVRSDSSRLNRVFDFANKLLRVQ